MNNEIKLWGLTSMTLEPIFVAVRKAWLRAAESHYNMSADYEYDAADTATAHAKEYQRLAALARSELRSLSGNSTGTERRTNRIKRVLFGLFNKRGVK